MDPQSTDSFQIKHSDFGDAEIDFQMKLMERLDEIEALKKSKISSEAQEQATPTTAVVLNRNEISLIIGAMDEQSPEVVDAEIDFQLKLMQRLDEIEAKKAKMTNETIEATKQHDAEI